MRRPLDPSIRLVAPMLLLLTSPACGGDGGATSSDSTSTTTATDAGTLEPTGSSGASTGGGSSDTGGTLHTSSAPEPTTSGSTTAEPGTSTTSSDTGSSDTGSSDTGSSDTGGSDTGGSDTGVLPGGELRVLQLNLCHSGVAGCFTGDAVMSKAVSVIQDVAPGLVTLNEVCRDDVPWLAAETGAVDHRFTPALRADNTPVKCKNGDDYGNGLLSWVAPTWDKPLKGVYAAQSSQTERRVWICMGYAGFVGCTTHLSTAGNTALAQCHELVDGPLSTAAADGPAVMAGDWNLKFKGNPDAQDCVPGGFYRKGDGAVQHMIATDTLGFLETIIIDMDGTTDHPGLEVRLTLP